MVFISAPEIRCAFLYQFYCSICNNLSGQSALDRHCGGGPDPYIGCQKSANLKPQDERGPRRTARRAVPTSKTLMRNLLVGTPLRGVRGVRIRRLSRFFARLGFYFGKLLAIAIAALPCPTGSRRPAARCGETAINIQGAPTELPGLPTPSGPAGRVALPCAESAFKIKYALRMAGWFSY
jgi:hypothetical protein